MMDLQRTVIHLSFGQLTLFVSKQGITSSCILADGLRSFGFFLKKLASRKYYKIQKKGSFALKRGFSSQDTLINYGAIGSTHQKHWLRYLFVNSYGFHK